MLGEKSIQLGPSDDDFHEPASNDPFWNETIWFSFSVPERALSGYVYPWVRANQGLFGGGVIVWDDRGNMPWEARVWDWASWRKNRSIEVSDGARCRGTVAGVGKRRTLGALRGT